MKSFIQFLSEAKKWGPVYKLTWKTDKGETVSQNFSDMGGLIRQEKYLKDIEWTIVSAQKRRPYGEWEEIR